MEFPIPVDNDLLELCRDWHSGQTSAMYSVSSTGSIYNKEILESLAAEFRACRRMTCQEDFYIILTNIIDKLDAIIEELE